MIFFTSVSITRNFSSYLHQCVCTLIVNIDSDPASLAGKDTNGIDEQHSD